MKKVFQYWFTASSSGRVHWACSLADLQTVILRKCVFSSQYPISRVFVWLVWGFFWWSPPPPPPPCCKVYLLSHLFFWLEKKRLTLGRNKNSLIEYVWTSVSFRTLKIRNPWKMLFFYFWFTERISNFSLH